MTDNVDDAGTNGAETDALARLTEEIASRLEAGDPVTVHDLGDDPAHAGKIRQLLPTLRTMVAFGDQIASEEGSRARLQKKSKRHKP